MPSYGDFDDALDDIDLGRRSLPPQSGPGIVSFGLGVLAAIGVGALLLLVVVLEFANPNGLAGNDDPETIIVGLGCCGLSLAGVVLGLAGVSQRDRNPLFAALGVVINGVVLLGTLFCVCVGILSDM